MLDHPINSQFIFLRSLLLLLLFFWVEDLINDLGQSNLTRALRYIPSLLCCAYYIDGGPKGTSTQQ